MMTRKFKVQHLSLQIFVFFVLLFSTQVGFAKKKSIAWKEPLFGPEFTFTLIEVHPDGTIEFNEPDYKTVALLSRRYTLVLLKNKSQNEEYDHEDDNSDLEAPLNIIEGKGSTAVKHEYVKTRTQQSYESLSDWGFNFSTDPGVIEYRMLPKTYFGYRKHATEIQNVIFEMAREINLIPALFLGGGHINIGSDIFYKNPLLFRNFFVDFCNHAELAMGIMNYDTNNALPFALGTAKLKKGIMAAVDKFDAQYRSGQFDSDDLLDSFTRRIGTLLNMHNIDDYLWPATPTRHEKYWALSLYRFDKTSSRVEIRSVRPQASFDVFLRQIRLFRNRLKYLHEINKPIPFKSEIQIITDRDDHDDRINPPINPQQALRAFYKYVRESGEKWSNHRDYIWPAWVNTFDSKKSELERFESSRWFKDREAAAVKSPTKKKNCRTLLKSINAHSKKSSRTTR